MTADPFQAAASAVEKEIAALGMTADVLERTGWIAFKHLRLFEFTDARNMILSGFEGAKTPGQLADMRDTSDRLLEALRATLDPAAREALSQEIAVLEKMRGEFRPKIETIRDAMKCVLAQFETLRSTGKDRLYNDLSPYQG